jgi:Ca2+-binding RTX toxin-like protein
MRPSPLDRTRAPEHPVATNEPLEPRRLLAADLIVSDVVVAPTLLGQPGLVRPAVVVRNVGTTRVDRVWSLRYAVSTDDVWGNGDDVTLGRATRAGLAAGASLMILDAVRLPDLSDGNYHLLALVDANNAVDEDDETNNSAATATASITALDGDGPLVINGTANTDDIALEVSGSRVTLRARSVGPDGRILNGGGTIFARRLLSLAVNASGGGDSIALNARGGFTVDAGTGDDTVVGGSGDDLITGGPGRDRLFGGPGNDRIVGGGGHDRLFGDAGDDTLSGGIGNDRLIGGAGADWLIGGDGTDSLFASDSARDTVSGNSGDDAAQVDDEEDLVTSVTTLIA